MGDHTNILMLDTLYFNIKSLHSCKKWVARRFFYLTSIAPRSQKNDSFAISTSSNMKKCIACLSLNKTKSFLRHEEMHSVNRWIFSLNGPRRKNGLSKHGSQIAASKRTHIKKVSSNVWMQCPHLSPSHGKRQCYCSVCKIAAEPAAFSCPSHLTFSFHFD